MTDADVLCNQIRRKILSRVKIGHWIEHERLANEYVKRILINSNNGLHELFVSTKISHVKNVRWWLTGLLKFALRPNKKPGSAAGLLLFL